MTQKINNLLRVIHKHLKCGRLLAIAAFFFSIASLQAQPNYEQIIFDHFQSHFLDTTLFKDECGGLKYNATNKINLKIDSSYSLRYKDALNYLADNTNDQLANIFRETDLKIDSIQNPKIRAKAKGKRFRKCMKADTANYLLRFSNRYFIEGKLYVEIWIKQAPKTFGTHVIYELAPQSGYIRKAKKYNLCDDAE